MKAIIHIRLKPGVLDPQGRAIANSLNNLGFSQVKNAFQGRVIELDLTGLNVSDAKNQVKDMCDKLLANTVIETYTIDIIAPTKTQNTPER